MLQHAEKPETETFDRSHGACWVSAYQQPGASPRCPAVRGRRGPRQRAAAWPAEPCPGPPAAAAPPPPPALASRRCLPLHPPPPIRLASITEFLHLITIVQLNLSRLPLLGCMHPKFFQAIKRMSPRDERSGCTRTDPEETCCTAGEGAGGGIEQGPPRGRHLPRRGVPLRRRRRRQRSCGGRVRLPQQSRLQDSFRPPSLLAMSKDAERASKVGQCPGEWKSNACRAHHRSKSSAMVCQV